ncbi:MAG: DUF4198 domain-containing protein [Planctomycetota bacterium]
MTYFSRHRNALAVVALAQLAGPVFAHDFWLQPSSFACSANEPIRFDLRVGTANDSEVFPRSPEHIRRFFSNLVPSAVGDDPPAPGDRPVAGQDGRAPAGFGRYTEAGLARVGYESNPSHVVLAGPEFEKYLRIEGLDWVVEERARLGESDASGRELFARCAVTALAVGDQPTGYGEPLGLELELVPSSNPDLVTVGESIAFTLLRDGRPVEGATVWMHGLGARDVASRSCRTDDRGRVEFEVATANAWLVTSVHMERASEELRTRDEDPVDWVSRWASFTFRSRSSVAVEPQPEVRGDAVLRRAPDRGRDRGLGLAAVAVERRAHAGRASIVELEEHLAPALRRPAVDRPDRVTVHATEIDARGPRQESEAEVLQLLTVDDQSPPHDRRDAVGDEPRPDDGRGDGFDRARDLRARDGSGKVEQHGDREHDPGDADARAEDEREQGRG